MDSINPEINRFGTIQHK